MIAKRQSGDALKNEWHSGFFPSLATDDLRIDFVYPELRRTMLARVAGRADGGQLLHSDAVKRTETEGLLT
jgi:hypothetical protein